MFAVANLRDRELEDHMDSVLMFLQENKWVDQWVKEPYYKYMV